MRAGCAISMASASIMTDLVKGKRKKKKEIVLDFLDMIKEKEGLENKILNDDEKTKLMCLSGVNNIQCVKYALFQAYFNICNK